MRENVRCEAQGSLSPSRFCFGRAALVGTLARAPCLSAVSFESIDTLLFSSSSSFTERCACNITEPSTSNTEMCVTPNTIRSPDTHTEHTVTDTGYHLPWLPYVLSTSSMCHLVHVVKCHMAHREPRALRTSQMLSQLSCLKPHRTSKLNALNLERARTLA